MRIKYIVELEKGYKQTMQVKEEHEMEIIIEAKNMVTANRMMKALLQGGDHVISCSAICID